MSWLLDPAGLTPHGFCLLWEPGLIWAYAISDVGIGLAYFTIPLALAIFARRRRDLVFRPILWLFATFILLCGASHFMDVLTLWVPAYGAEIIVKAATACVSIVTAIALWWLMPQALALPSSAQLQAVNTALQESEARYRASFEQSPVPMHIFDGADVIQGVSRSWLALLGYRREEVVGHHLSKFWAPGLGPWDEADRRKLMTDGEIINLERRFVRRDGTAIDVLVSARLEHLDGTVSIVAALTDTTARKQAEEALRATEERLHQAQKMEAVGQLTGGIAHDFNNTLQSISGALGLMERDIARGRPDGATRFIGIALKSIERAAGLTHRMLAFARRQALQPRSVESDSLVNGMAELLRHTLGPGVELQMHLHDGVWSVFCDPNQLESALLNLAINARDAMPNGGSLTIYTADLSLSQADLSDQDEARPGDYVEMAVTDIGIGMAADVMARVFEPFFTTKPIGKGTGLGLSQVFGFVRQSGGFVRLKSKPGVGTTVCLYLPRYQKAKIEEPEIESSTEAIEAATPGQTTGKTVLVVEDETDVRAMIVDVLSDLGCRVLEAENGNAGMRLVQYPAHLDLLVTDVGLPGLNGRQLADAARESHPGLPVVLITGYAGKALDDAALAPGMEILRKPFALDVLAGRVAALLKPTAKTDRGLPCRE